MIDRPRPDAGEARARAAPLRPARRAARRGPARLDADDGQATSTASRAASQADDERPSCGGRPSAPTSSADRCRAAARGVEDAARGCSAGCRASTARRDRAGSSDRRAPAGSDLPPARGLRRRALVSHPSVAREGRRASRARRTRARRRPRRETRPRRGWRGRGPAASGKIGGSRRRKARGAPGEPGHRQTERGDTGRRERLQVQRRLREQIERERKSTAPCAHPPAPVQPVRGKCASLSPSAPAAAGRARERDPDQQPGRQAERDRSVDHGWIPDGDAGR